MWNRICGEFVDVVDAQVSKSRDRLTVNLGVYSREIYIDAWPNEQIEFINIVNCIVSVKIGYFSDNIDVWWDIASDSGSSEIAHLLEKFSGDFFRSLHCLRGIELSLEQSGARRSSYPLPAIYLAITIMKQGGIDSGCQLLRGLNSGNLSAWQPRIEHVLRKYCAEL